MKYFYIVVQIEENGRMYAHALRRNSNQNLWHELNRINGICCAQIMPTKQAACELVERLNEAFRYTGIYMFDTMPDGSPVPF